VLHSHSLDGEKGGVVAVGADRFVVSDYDHVLFGSHRGGGDLERLCMVLIRPSWLSMGAHRHLCMCRACFCFGGIQGRPDSQS
jgi:hypothetical protein